MGRSSGSPIRRGFGLALLAALALVLGGCRVERALTPSLPPVAGSLGASGVVTQPFYSPANGLNRLSIGIVQPEPRPGQSLRTLGGGATVEIRYAPAADNRFPQPAFHDWPADQQWLGELTGTYSFGQSFYSPYPNLDGLTVRGATFGGDLTPGEAQLAPGSTVTVRALPVDGAPVTTLPGGATVMVEGSAEGWAAVRLDDGQRGYVALNQFAKLPPPARVNNHDVVLTLYREPDLVAVRRTTINASTIPDNAHLTFRFDPLPDSMGARYRFVITSPDSTPGNAVTFRYAPTSSYAGGTRFEDGKPVSGALVFNPDYAPGAPLYRGSLDSFNWSEPTLSLEGSFAPLANTADRFLAVVVSGGNASLQLHWSTIRPPGGQPLTVEGDPQAPAGGLVFNTGYWSNFPIGTSIRQAAGGVLRAARADPAFFALYALALLGVIGWWGWLLGRRRLRGR